MTGCPFHDLPPGQTVELRSVDGRLMSIGSAELWCQDWHDAQAMKPIFDEMLAAALKLEL